MKRFIVILLVLHLVLLSACSLPFFGGNSSDSSALADGQKMVQMTESSNNDNSSNSIADIGSDGKTSTTGGAINDNAGGIATENTGVAGITTNTGQTGQEMQSVTTEAGISSSIISVSPENENNQIKDDAETIETAEPKNNSGIMAGLPFEENAGDKGIIFAENRQPVTVYYQDKDGYLVPMTRWIQLQQGIARAAVSLCIDSAMAREELAYYGVYPLLPEGTEILGVDIRDGTAIIDFNKNLLNYSSSVSERNIITSIIYTMTEFKTIRKVRILINGYKLGVLKYGTDVSGTIGREDIAINADESILRDGTGKADIFLFKKVNEGFTYLVPIAVSGMESTDEQPEFLVRQLLSKDSDGFLHNEMPFGADLLDWDISNGVLLLNFSDSFTDYGGNSKEEGILQQIIYTVKQIEGIQKLKLFVEGSQVQLPEGTEISKGLTVPATINDVIDR